jgi:PRC-barrel domain protein
MDLGPPASYLTVEADLPVFSSDGEKVGVVEHVLADPDEDVFDGLVIDISPLPGGHRFVDAPQVDEIRERGVVLALSAGEARSLPEPSENPVALSATPDDVARSDLEIKLKRAWDLITGNY